MSAPAKRWQSGDWATVRLIAFLLTLLLMSGFLSALLARAGDAPLVYVEIIVKACPADETPAKDKPAAVLGYYHAPINQDTYPADARSKTHAEREAALTAAGCIDVPIPPEIIGGYAEMTMDRCRGTAGYLASMQYLEQNPTITQKAVGGWVCVPHAFPVTGTAGL